ncbi:hypothetical protein DPMN_101745 [Dreissena polymorpha]|uniref:Uncharacterized protein n=1 Tax=Dreissena polymorpha TaxID=45954 RepID=A0A9D4LK19_DREPO|nr:hypothetical protein DPMN_101745 [Dreissena polymorpha]
MKNIVGGILVPKSKKCIVTCRPFPFRYGLETLPDGRTLKVKLTKSELRNVTPTAVFEEGCIPLAVTHVHSLLTPEQKEAQLRKEWRHYARYMFSLALGEADQKHNLAFSWFTRFRPFSVDHEKDLVVKDKHSQYVVRLCKYLKERRQQTTREALLNKLQQVEEELQHSKMERKIESIKTEVVQLEAETKSDNTKAAALLRADTHKRETIGNEFEKIDILTALKKENKNEEAKVNSTKIAKSKKSTFVPRPLPPIPIPTEELKTNSIQPNKAQTTGVVSRPLPKLRNETAELDRTSNPEAAKMEADASSTDTTILLRKKPTLIEVKPFANGAPTVERELKAEKVGRTLFINVEPKPEHVLYQKKAIDAIAKDKCDKIHNKAFTADLLAMTEDIRVFRGHLLEAFENAKDDFLQMENFEILYKGMYQRMLNVVQRQITAFTRARRLVNRYCNNYDLWITNHIDGCSAYGLYTVVSSLKSQLQNEESRQHPSDDGELLRQLLRNIIVSIELLHGTLEIVETACKIKKALVNEETETKKQFEKLFVVNEEAHIVLDECMGLKTRTNVELFMDIFRCDDNTRELMNKKLNNRKAAKEMRYRDDETRQRRFKEWMNLLHTPVCDQSTGATVINKPKEKCMTVPLSSKREVIGDEKNEMCYSTSSPNEDDDEKNEMFYSTSSPNEDDDIDLEKDECLLSDLDEKPKCVYTTQIPGPISSWRHIGPNVKYMKPRSEVNGPHSLERRSTRVPLIKKGSSEYWGTAQESAHAINTVMNKDWGQAKESSTLLYKAKSTYENISTQREGTKQINAATDKFNPNDPEYKRLLDSLIMLHRLQKQELQSMKRMHKKHMHEYKREENAYELEQKMLKKKNSKRRQAITKMKNLLKDLLKQAKTKMKNRITNKMEKLIKGCNILKSKLKSIDVLKKKKNEKANTISNTKLSEEHKSSNEKSNKDSKNKFVQRMKNKGSPALQRIYQKNALRREKKQAAKSANVTITKLLNRLKRKKDPSSQSGLDACQSGFNACQRGLNSTNKSGKNLITETPKDRFNLKDPQYKRLLNFLTIIHRCQKQELLSMKRAHKKEMKEYTRDEKKFMKEYSKHVKEIAKNKEAIQKNRLEEKEVKKMFKEVGTILERRPKKITANMKRNRKATEKRRNKVNKIFKKRISDKGKSKKDSQNECIQQMKNESSPTLQEHQKSEENKELRQSKIAKATITKLLNRLRMKKDTCQSGLNACPNDLISTNISDKHCLIKETTKDVFNPNDPRYRRLLNFLTIIQRSEKQELQLMQWMHKKHIKEYKREEKEFKRDQETKHGLNSRVKSSKHSSTTDATTDVFNPNDPEYKRLLNFFTTKHHVQKQELQFMKWIHKQHMKEYKWEEKMFKKEQKTSGSESTGKSCNHLLTTNAATDVFNPNDPKYIRLLNFLTVIHLSQKKELQALQRMHKNDMKEYKREESAFKREQKTKSGFKSTGKSDNKLLTTMTTVKDGAVECVTNYTSSKRACGIGEALGNMKHQVYRKVDAWLELQEKIEKSLRERNVLTDQLLKRIEGHSNQSSLTQYSSTIHFVSERKRMMKQMSGLRVRTQFKTLHMREYRYLFNRRYMPHEQTSKLAGFERKMLSKEKQLLLKDDEIDIAFEQVIMQTSRRVCLLKQRIERCMENEEKDRKFCLKTKHVDLNRIVKQYDKNLIKFHHMYLSIERRLRAKVANVKYELENNLIRSTILYKQIETVCPTFFEKSKYTDLQYLKECYTNKKEEIFNAFDKYVESVLSSMYEAISNKYHNDIAALKRMDLLNRKCMTEISQIRLTFLPNIYGILKRMSQQVEDVQDLVDDYILDNIDKPFLSEKQNAHEGKKHAFNALRKWRDSYRKAVLKEFENMEKSVRNQLLNHYERYFDEDNKDITSMWLKLLTWFRMRYSTKVGSNRVLFLKMIEATQGLASHPESRAAFTETTSHPDNVFKWMRMNFPQLNTRKCRRTTQVCLNENDIVVEDLEDGYCSTSNNCRPELQNPMASDFSYIYNSLSAICLKPKREQYDAWIQYYLKNTKPKPNESIMLSNDSRSCTTPPEKIDSADNETKTDNTETQKPKQKKVEKMKKSKTTDIKTAKKTDITTDKTNEKKLKKTKQFSQKENTAKKSFGKKLKHMLRKSMPFRKAVSLNGSESKVSDRANNVLQKDDEALLQNNDLVQTEIKAPSTTEVTIHQEIDVNEFKGPEKKMKWWKRVFRKTIARSKTSSGRNGIDEAVDALEPRTDYDWTKDPGWQNVQPGTSSGFVAAEPPTPEELAFNGRVWSDTDSDSDYEDHTSDAERKANYVDSLLAQLDNNHRSGAVGVEKNTAENRAITDAIYAALDDIWDDGDGGL